MGQDYSHSDHGEMEWYSFDGWQDSVEGWRCSDCHVIAEPDNADEVFDNHDCEQYQSVREGVSGAL